jgi:hypothetical protein
LFKLLAFSNFRQWGLAAEGAPVYTWSLKIDSSSKEYDALYAHIDDIYPIGFLVCKL